MVAALWSNSNWDDDKGSRKKAIADIESNYKEAIEAVELALSTRTVQEDEKLNDDNPFFAAAERGLSRVETEYKGSGASLPEPSKDEIDYMKGLDQE